MHITNYSVGEVRALLAPLFGCKAEDIGEIVIVADSPTFQKVGVFSTMCCDIRIHYDAIALALLARGIESLATKMYEDGPQHGPGE